MARMHKRIFCRSKFKVTRDISPTISGWLLVLSASLKVAHFMHCSSASLFSIRHSFLDTVCLFVYLSGPLASIYVK